MFKLAIPRGRLSHSVIEDLLCLLKVPFSKLNDKEAVETFEIKFADYMGAGGCVAFPLARTGIHSVLKNQNFKPGSTIIMPPLTIKGILDVVLDLELSPVFVDLDLENACFSYELLEKALVQYKPKAIIVTYLFGIVPDVEKMIELLRKYEVFIIEDFSQTLNGMFDGKKVGTFGDCGVFSASSIKTLDTFSGGFIISSDASLIQKLKAIQNSLSEPSRKLLFRTVWKNLVRNLGTNRMIFSFITFPLIVLANRFGFKGVIRFSGNRPQYPIEKLPEWWFHSYTSFQAKFGIKQLAKVEDNDRKRQNNFLKANNGNPIAYLKGGRNSDSVFWQNILIVSDAKAFMNHLRQQKIDSALSSLILLSKLEKYGINGETPNAKTLYTNGVYTPCYSSLKNSDLERLASAFQKSSRFIFLNK
jgi:perosamine synthetase